MENTNEYPKTLRLIYTGLRMNSSNELSSTFKIDSFLEDYKILWFSVLKKQYFSVGGIYEIKQTTENTYNLVADKFIDRVPTEERMRYSIADRTAKEIHQQEKAKHKMLHENPILKDIIEPLRGACRNMTSKQKTAFLAYLMESVIR